MERLHVSLHHLGDFKHLPSGILHAARRAGEAVSAGPFEIVLHAMGTLGDARSRRRPLVLLAESEPLRLLHRHLAAAVRRNGLKAAERFTPHMTLSYGRQAFTARPIVPIRFVAEAFCLVHSELGLGRYRVLERWPLDASSR